MGRKSREKRERRAQQNYWLDDDRRTAVARVQTLIQKLDDEAPGVLDLLQPSYDVYREHASDSWPDACWLPLLAIEAGLDVVGECWPRALPARLHTHPTKYLTDIALLATWMQTQTVLYYDADLVHQLTRPNDVANLPPKALLQMPVWCPYITFPAGVAPNLGGDREITGFLGRIEWPGDAAEYEPLLHVGFPDPDNAISSDRLLHERVVYLDRQTIREGAVDALATGLAGLPHTKRESLRFGPEGMDSSQWKAMIQQADDPDRIERMLRTVIREAEWTCALLLYACATNADIVDPQTGPVSRGTLTASKGAPHLWDVGWRIGAQLRSHGPQSHSQGTGPSGRAAPRPHVRKAHWHHFWAGSRTGTPDERKLMVKWLPPTLVAANGAPIIPTVRGAGQALDEAA